MKGKGRNKREQEDFWLLAAISMLAALLFEVFEDL